MVIIYSLDVLFSQFKPVLCSISDSNSDSFASWPAYRFLGRQERWSGIPSSSRIFHSFFVIYTVKGFGIVSEAEVDVFSGILLLFLWPYGCWRFDLWFLCLFKIQLAHLEVFGSCTVEAQLEGFWALPCYHMKWKFEHFLELPFFGIRMKTDLFQSWGHCWVFQIYWHCSTLTVYGLK